ncbi:MAG: polysaccharide biosynthesis/export family protein [Gloeobacterales cyanobacterium]
MPSQSFSLMILTGFLSVGFPLTLAAAPVQAETFNLSVDQAGNRLSPGDKVRLTVVGFPELSGEQVVLNDGTIQMPMAGDISLEGLSPVEAKDRITEAIKPYVRRPQVSLALLNRRTPRISITGEVNRPGPRQLNKSNPAQINEFTQAGPAEFPTVSSSLLLAGGVTPNADLRNVIIRREGHSNASSPQPMASSTLPQSSNASPSSDIPKQEIKVNLWNAIRTGSLGDDPQVYDGDEIVVPAAQLAGPEQRALLASTVAPDKINIQVAGQVKSPGALTLAPNSDVTTAIAAAGGPTDKANTSAVSLMRMSADGKVDRQTFAFGQTSRPLMNGDVILVEKSGTSATLDFLGEAVGPLFPLYRLLIKGY